MARGSALYSTPALRYFRKDGIAEDTPVFTLPFGRIADLRVVGDVVIASRWKGRVIDEVESA